MSDDSIEKQLDRIINRVMIFFGALLGIVCLSVIIVVGIVMMAIVSVRAEETKQISIVRGIVEGR